jgi:hypothetical protein
VQHTTARIQRLVNSSLVATRIVKTYFFELSVFAAESLLGLDAPSEDAVDSEDELFSEEVSFELSFLPA